MISDKILNSVIAVLFVASLVACGGGGGSGGSDSSAAMKHDNTDANENDNLLRGEGQSVSNQGSLTLVDSVNGDFAELRITEFGLPNGLMNAKENTGTPQYIGRTAMRHSGDDAVKTPIRSYVAHCTDNDGKDNLFVSMSLQEGSNAADRVGSVYQLQYDASSNNYIPVNNSVILSGLCDETHGVAVSANCSRVAVICEAPHNESASSSLVTKDIASTISDFNQGDNGAYVSGWTNISEMLDYVFDDPNWPQVFDAVGMPPISEVLGDLQRAFPGNGFDEGTTYKDLDNNDAFLQVVEDSAAVQSNASKIIDGLQDFHFEYLPELWLLEWNESELHESFDAYVIAKNAGNARSSLNLKYVENDSKGRTSYAFSSEANEYFGAKNNHTSVALFVIDRDKWEIDLYAADGSGRGWSWECSHGHAFQARTLYNPETERYATLCSSDNTYDGNPKSDVVGGGQLGTVSIKPENQTHLTTGKTAYYVPVHSSPIFNGGGHTVVPVNTGVGVNVTKGDGLMAISSPQMITPSGKDDFMVSVENYLSSIGKDFSGWNQDKKCYEYHRSSIRGGCDIAIYYSNANEDSWVKIPVDFYLNSVLWAPQQSIDPRYYTKVGVRFIDQNNLVKNGLGIKWIAGANWEIDSDGDPAIGGQKIGDGTGGTVVSCTYGAPQLVDLENGRYLMGYAKYLCSDHKLNNQRYYERIGGTAMLIPRAYYLVEIDADGNILEGPVELSHDKLGDLGWGALDEMIPLGNGKAAWMYKPDPTVENVETPTATSPQSDHWRAFIYNSKY